MKIIPSKIKINGWLKNSTSPHFDFPTQFFKGKPSEKNVIPEVILGLLKYLDDPQNIAQHPFYPFIGYEIIERKFSRIKEGEESIEKSRPIRYAAHFDSYIYAYTAYKLSKIYEERILELGLDKVVSAYRKTREGMLSRNNVLMANEVFTEIKKRNNDCVALAFDIKKFYDHIDHKKLKQEWESLLGQSRLPGDMFNIYESLTKYVYVEIKDICIYFREKNNPNCCWCRSCEPKKDFKYLKLPTPIFKNSHEYHKFKVWGKKRKEPALRQNKGLLEDKENPYGIPQGSAMSSLLSNIYMIPFDIKMTKLAEDLGGLYRRYCDDIIFVCERSQRGLVEKEIKAAISERGKHLIIHEIDDNKLNSKSQCHDFTDEKIKRRTLKYLGFSFDGKVVSIREEKLANYLRKSKRGIFSARKGAEIKLREMYNKKQPFEKKHKKLFRKTLYDRYTHLGKRNFISYSHNSFKEIGDEKIKQQVKNHYKRVQDLIDDEDKKLKIFLENEGYKKPKKIRNVILNTS
jgi:RNA-directed DNA polymerase